jgi:hypothetical protein
MDSTRSPAPPAVAGSTPRPHLGRNSTVSLNKLTLATLVIAVAGFAGTALAADPPSFDPQATPSFAATC